MTVGLLVGTAVLGGLGAVLRLVLDGAVTRRTGSGLPFGTLAVNLSGAFVLGLLSGLAPGSAAYRLLGTGLIGAFTTFSTWMYETHRLAEDGQFSAARQNLLVSLALGGVLAWAGSTIGGGL